MLIFSKELRKLILISSKQYAKKEVEMEFIFLDFSGSVVKTKLNVIITK